MSSAVVVEDPTDQGQLVSYGDGREFMISKELLEHVRQTSCRLGVSGEALIQPILEEIVPKQNIDEANAGKKPDVVVEFPLVLELAVYGRAVLGIHPRDLHAVVRHFSEKQRAIFVSVSSAMGRQKQARSYVGFSYGLR